MKREQLKAMELEDTVIDKIMELHGKDIEAHKGKIEAAESSAADIQKQLDEANQTIEGFKNMKPDELQASVDEWKAKAEQFKTEAEQAKTEAAAKLEEYQFNSALTDALRGAKVKDPADVLPHIKRDEVIFKDGQIVDGLERQLSALKENKDYLFNSDTPEPKIVTKTDGKTTVPMSAFEAAAMKGAGLPVE